MEGDGDEVVAEAGEDGTPSEEGGSSERVDEDGGSSNLGEGIYISLPEINTYSTRWLCHFEC